VFSEKLRPGKGAGKATPGDTISRVPPGPHAVEDPAHASKHFVREPGGPTSGHGRWCRGPHRESANRSTPMMHRRRKSDRPVVPGKSPNKGSAAAAPPAEEREGRGLAKGNPRKQTRSRAQDGKACNKRWSGYGKQRQGIERCSSPRSGTMSMMWLASGRPTSVSSATPHREWTA
jgi:hypothetical protein